MMSPPSPQNLIVGPILGYFVSCTVEKSQGGYCASGEVADSEAALSSGGPLPRIAVGPVASPSIAQAMLVGHVRWQIENRNGPFASVMG